jgi:hypothetical protein
MKNGDSVRGHVLAADSLSSMRLKSALNQVGNRGLTSASLQAALTRPPTPPSSLSVGGSNQPNKPLGGKRS